jgi:hypothetical protein
MMDRRASALRGVMTVAAIAAVWAVVAIVIHAVVVLPLSLSLLDRVAPPAWWVSSRLPWPVSFLDAVIFALASAVFLRACVRFGISGSLALLGVVAGIGAIWAWVFAQALFLSWAIGLPEVSRWVHSSAPVNMSGSAGAVIGALLASGTLPRIWDRLALRKRVVASA